MFVDLDWPLNASSLLSASAELLVLSRSDAGALFVRGVDSSDKHCVAVYCPISTRFSAFFSEGIALSDALYSSHFVARWRHNIREIAVENCENAKNRRKSLCAPLRIDSWGFWKKFYCSSLGSRL